MKTELEELKGIVGNYKNNVEYGSNVSRADIERRILELTKLEKTKIISAFPACGKTYMFNNSELSIIDSDSSEFSWLKDKNGNNTKERNPNFPNNYIEHIKKNLGEVDIIFISSHEVVRKAMVDNDINYTLIYPSIELNEEWIKRFVDRGNDDSFIMFISNNWETFINDIEQETYPNKIKLNSNEYISDKI